jgi:hypothetical protein
MPTVTKQHHIRLTRHARRRSSERDLDREVIADVAQAAFVLLNGRVLRFRHKGHTVVATKAPDGDVKVITAWEK